MYVVVSPKNLLSLSAYNTTTILCLLPRLRKQKNDGLCTIIIIIIIVLFIRRWWKIVRTKKKRGRKYIYCHHVFAGFRESLELKLLCQTTFGLPGSSDGSDLGSIGLDSAWLLLSSGQLIWNILG